MDKLCLSSDCDCNSAACGQPFIFPEGHSPENNLAPSRSLREARPLGSRAGRVVTGALCWTQTLFAVPTAMYQVQPRADGLKRLRSFGLYYGPQISRTTIRWHWPWAWHSSRLFTPTNSVSTTTPWGWNRCLSRMRRQRLRELQEFPPRPVGIARGELGFGP